MRRAMGKFMKDNFWIWRTKRISFCRTRYGFVTFEEAADAFRAIETAKEDSIINMYDVSFGGRRAFCGSSYADLGE